ncbi:Dauer Up-regulated [Corallococcus sp. EGB]|uniref:Dauer Up-regulated n=1 Tax=Corallococcus sp. EGB TaxID=1521117 RepID=UPI001CBFEDCE|nr:Dauer Up-regulated [Corallococcus sp. EGB]
MTTPIDGSAAAAARAAAEAAARAAAEAAARAAAAAKAAAEQAAKAAAEQAAKLQQQQQTKQPTVKLFNDGFSSGGAQNRNGVNRLTGETTSPVATPLGLSGGHARPLSGPVQANASGAVPARADVNGAAPAADPKPPHAEALPDKPEDLPKLFPELKDKKKEDLKKAYDSLNKLGTGSFSEKATALGELASQFPETVPNALERLGLKDDKLAKLATQPDALTSLGKLTDPKASTTDKAQAALTLAKSAGDIFAPQDLKGVLDTALKGLPAAEKLVGAIGKWTDPNASATDKARATLELGKALKDFAGDKFPALANDLRKLDGSLRAAGAAITLVDPNASTQDKALAAAQLLAEVPDLKKDLKAFTDVLKNAGVKNATDVAQQGSQLADVKVKGLDPQLASRLTPDQLKKLEAAATRLGGPESMEAALKGITDPKALDNLVGQLGKLDAAGGKRLVGSLGGLEHKVLNEVLSDPKTTEQFAKLAGKLDDDAAKVVSKLVKEMDSGALKSLLKLTDGLGADALNTTVKGLGPLLDKAGSKLVGQGLKVMDKVLGKIGVEITADVAGKVFKNLAKVVPVAGALPNAIDAVKYEQESLDLHGKNNDLGYFAHTAAVLNTADGALGIALDLTGVGVAVDVGASVLLGAAELAMDIGFSQEKEKFEKDPKGYKAPDWMKAVNLAGAAAQGPAGLAHMAAYYGPEGAAQLIQWGVEKGAKGAVKAAEFVGVSQAELAGEGLKGAAKVIHKLADVVRNPSKYGEAAVKAATEAFNTAIEKGGELAKEAKQVLDDVIDGAKKLGEKGLETLKYIAQNPGEAAKKALDGIKSVVDSGLDLATDAGKALYKQAVSTLNDLKAGYDKLTGAAKEKARELIDGATTLVSNTVNKARELGEKGLELLAWTAQHPGEAAAKAKEAIGDALAKGGELAKKAWGAVKDLGAAGAELAEGLVKGLANAGEQAVETLKYIAQNPGEALSKAGEWVGSTLSSMARKGGELATKAAGAIKDFVDNRVSWAKDFARDLLKDGVESFKNVAKAWKDNLTEGGKELLVAVADLGDAGVDALKDLAGAGGQLAEAAVGHLSDLAKNGVEAAKDALGFLSDLGGEIGDLAGDAFDGVKDVLSKLNPLGLIS